MNKDIISGKWTQLKGKAQAKWGDLTDDDFKVAGQGGPGPRGGYETGPGRIAARFSCGCAGITASRTPAGPARRRPGTPVDHARRFDNGRE